MSLSTGGENVFVECDWGDFHIHRNILKFSQREKVVERKTQYSHNKIFKQIKYCVLLQSTIENMDL